MRFGKQWHQLDHMQTICTLLQTDNHTNTSSLNFLQAGCSSWCPKSTEGTLLRISSNQRMTEPKPISTEPYAASKLDTKDVTDYHTDQPATSWTEGICRRTLGWRLISFIKFASRTGISLRRKANDLRASGFSFPSSTMTTEIETE